MRIDGIYIPAELERAIAMAKSDDGKVTIGTDVRPLKALARKLGGERLASTIDKLAEHYEAPKVSKTRVDSGYATRVVTFNPGPGGSSEADLQKALGRPEGAGPNQGSLDVVKLGKSGSIVLEFHLPPGATFDLAKVFGNEFSGWREDARVELSANGRTWHEMSGRAGRNSVQINSQNSLDVRRAAAGGDAFKFADAGLAASFHPRYMRITDLGMGSGFDLDAAWIGKAG